MLKHRPDFSRLTLNEQQRHKVAILYIESGEKKTPIHRKEVSVLCEVLETRNAFRFMRKPARGLLQRGTNSYWLPIECARKEIKQARAAKGDYSYYHERWNKKRFKVAQLDKGANHFQRRIGKYLAKRGEKNHYFYGIEAKCADGPAAMCHYLKIGIAQSAEHLEKRFEARAKGDKWYGKNQKARGRFALPLKPGVRARDVERLFEESFGTHCTKRENGKRYLKEFFKFDRTIAAFTKKLCAKYPHPRGGWSKEG